MPATTRPGREQTSLMNNRRLATSDLILARYYDRIDNAFGARLHAERALQAAVASSLEPRGSPVR